MTNFTNSPFEKLMKQRPRQRQEKPSPVLPNPCHGCNYLHSGCCTGVCYRELILPNKKKKVDK